jgi:CRP-like cAMP-binding protein
MGLQSHRNTLTLTQNRLLASLANANYERLRSRLEPVCLEFKRPLYEANKPIDFVYFIETGVASLVNTMRNGDAAEVGTIGNEGIVGLPIVFGDKQAPASVYMQVRRQVSSRTNCYRARRFERPCSIMPKPFSIRSLKRLPALIFILWRNDVAVGF